MRLNKYIAQNTDYSRRSADDLISKGQVKVNGTVAKVGQAVDSGDQVYIDKLEVGKIKTKAATIKLHKPTGYVCSRDGQGSPTVYELLPDNLQHLNYTGRLDKDSSGLLIMSSDGELINQLSHPRHQKTKVYEVLLDQPLQPLHQQIISDIGVTLSDGSSRFQIEKIDSGKNLLVTMTEGRNRQIRRTFEALGYRVQKLHRIQFGPYSLAQLKEGELETT